MSTKTEVIRPKTVKIHDLDEFTKLLKGLKVASCMLTESHQVVDEESVLKRLSNLTFNGASDGNCCSCCGVGPFQSRAQQTAHYKNHWHTHNLKRKLFGKTPLTLGQFNSRQDDNSSVSGSDSETEDTSNKPANELFQAATRHCKAFFTNQKGQVFCIYRCVLHHRKEELSTDGEGHAWSGRCEKLLRPGQQRWAVLMVSGGHFAGAVFAGGSAVLHKTQHSYVTRRGQGQAQATRDQHASAPKSAGASLRRYNQQQFLEHIQDILTSWATDLAGCSLVLYRAVGPTNQATLFGKNSPLSRDDMRVRALPFPTRKPTYKEVQRVHDTLASVEVYETMELFQKALISSSGRPASKNNSDTSVDERGKRQQKSPKKPIDRAKSRERTPRELPTQALISSEDETPCYIDSETPSDWIRTLSEQTPATISSSRRDLLHDCVLPPPPSSDDDDVDAQQQKKSKKKKKKKQEDSKVVKKPVAPPVQKIPANIKKLWKYIAGEENTSLETILEGWEGELVEACNTQDLEGDTALHKAARAEKPDMVTQLLSAGGDPCVRNKQLQTPYAAAARPDTRLAFRLFQGLHPDKYNYSKSQIPGPMTLEQLEQEKEKKAQQKKSKRQRDKEKQQEKIKTNKFLQLTDAEKVKTEESRCFLCASSLPKVPFEYDNYKFCGIRCLQNHRNLRPLNMST